MDDQQQQNGAELQQQQQRPGKVQLGEFWLQAPNAWFTTADLKFEVVHITSEREPFGTLSEPWASTSSVLCWIW